MVGHGIRSAEGAGLLRGAGVPWLVDVPHDAGGAAKNRFAETIRWAVRVQTTLLVVSMVTASGFGISASAAAS
jgi:hypothetical protein